MDMLFGKYIGKPVAWVLIEDPGYFDWMRKKEMTSRSEYQFMLKLLNILDSKPFSEVVCSGSECGRKGKVTRLTLYDFRYNMTWWWCDNCDPYSQGASSGKLSSISRMSEVIFHPDNERLVKAFANAKGVPARKTKAALKKYFGY